jgi:hypothetical protein
MAMTLEIDAYVHKQGPDSEYKAKEIAIFQEGTWDGAIGRWTVVVVPPTGLPFEVALSDLQKVVQLWPH